MAKAYQVVRDVSLPRPVGKIGDDDDAQFETTGVNYAAGSYLLADNLTPRDRKRAEDGELDHLLRPVSDEDAEQIAGDGGQESVIGVFVPEHEAERHALRMAGHVVVSKEQELEALSSSVDHARQYQEAVKEHGLDQRPVQEHFAQDDPAVPAEVLVGAETRSGLPHNRGEEISESEGESDETPAEQPRPRPGAEQTSTETQGETSDSSGGESESESQE